ncbi:E3 ubiquitin-protein ligase MYLIP-A-like protein [Dinothrombium tinctorium]|uniref:E3 ubiquitin-protein ligase MYLIP-A-like protein n=1 Tax=Dinothrombium tinctorium TaxID=1965070 RepID=A0A3S4R1D2_9ACAR|nr:E3 ubiquitin-protein ligase MYLIP-A-like protein [Dinothrombium tinctorium]RWS10349.1 E3 ubiquitin-protein ligase MYLIP-A-like protein [Dinothrombium tinctorium]
MLCLVKNPNSVVIEVDVDCKAKGQQCLDKVCQMLGIVEVDYFGLQYIGNHDEQLWLNMRNPIRQQLTGPPPYRLQLRVKFFVPPHLLLQESTRHQFYLSLVQDIQEGRLRVEDKRKAIQLTALIAQIELGDLESSNEITAALLNYPKWLPPNICDHSKEPLTSPLSTRRRGKRRKHHSGASEPETISDNDFSVEPCDHEATKASVLSPFEVCKECSEQCHDLSKLCNLVLKLHRSHKGLKPSKAEYLFLKEASTLEDVGVEYFSVRSNLSPDEPLNIGLGPRGVTVKEENSNRILYSIAYSSIHIATHAGRYLDLTFIESNGELQSLEFKCESMQAANAIYRAVTEKHAFYSCETVRHTVTSQFIRDFKGTIVSLFDENTTFGKNYVFDVRRTYREVYDNTRRMLYSLEAKANEAVDVEGERNLLDEAKSNEYFVTKADQVSDCEDFCHKPRCQDIQKKLSTLQDSMLCRICMDSDVCTAFFPCRHVVCCRQCAPLCDICPLCRSDVSNFQQIYLPLSENDVK